MNNGIKKVKQRDMKQYKYIPIVWVLILVGSLWLDKVNAQDIIKAGAPYPDIHLSHIINAPYTEVHTSDFRGKVLVFYSWTTYCGGCIANFPTLDSLQRRYANDIQIILVSYQDEKTIIKMFDRMKALGITYQLPNAILDIQSFRQFLNVDGTLGGSVWIGKNGKTLGRGAKITTESIESAINGKYLQNDFLKAYTDTSNRQGEILRQSIWKTYSNQEPDFAMSSKSPDTDNPYGNIQFKNFSIQGLFQRAYDAIPEFEMPLYRIEWHVRDSAYYLPYLVGWDSLKYSVAYGYEITMPHASRGDLLLEMRKDLDSYFKLRRVEEVRKVKGLRLVKLPDGTSASKGGQPLFEKDNYGLQMVNKPISNLLYALRYYMRSNYGFAEIVDDTGIEYNIDLDFVVNWRKDVECLPEVREGLNKYGLDLVEDNLSFHVLHIYDSN